MFRTDGETESGKSILEAQLDVDGAPIISRECINVVIGKFQEISNSAFYSIDEATLISFLGSCSVKKFPENYWQRIKTPEEDWRVERPKRCEYSNPESVNSENNYISTQKF